MNRKFKHTPTDREFTTELIGQNKVEGIKWGDWEIPMWVVENTNDWEEIIAKTYEILSFISIAGEFSTRRKNELFLNDSNKDKEGEYIEESHLDGEYWKIHSIKKLSTGEIFTVGDKVYWNWSESSQKFFILEKIEILEGDINLFMKYECGFVNEFKSLFDYKDLKHYKEPIFTTCDGVEVFEGDVFWNVNPLFELNEYQVINDKYELMFLNDGSKQFSTKEAAEKYSILNKPQYSVSDIVKFVNDIPEGSVNEEKVIQYFNER